MVALSGTPKPELLSRRGPMRDHGPSPTGGTPVPWNCRNWLAAAIAWLIASGAPAHAEGPPGPDGAVLHLANGGFVAGALADSDEPGRLRWQSPAFAAPFEFELDDVATVLRSGPAER